MKYFQNNDSKEEIKRVLREFNVAITIKKTRQSKTRQDKARQGKIMKIKIKKSKIKINEYCGLLLQYVYFLL